MAIEKFVVRIRDIDGNVYCFNEEKFRLNYR